MKIPFLDLKAHHAPLRAEIDAAIGQVIDAGAFAGGPFVARFEEEFAAFCNVPHAVGVGSGTDALWLCLLALGIGPGDEVITVPHTFIATAEAISYCGATPVFVDIDETTYTMDPGQLERAITPRTKAIIPVHIFGQCAEMDPILAIAREHDLVVVEDAAQAHGSEYKGRRTGSMGVAACFSFYPGKNLGAFGEAGAVVTASQELRDKIRILRDHGQPKKYLHSMIGWNGRMDGIQAAVLSVKLKRLTQANGRRQANARLYDELLDKVDQVIRPQIASDRNHIYHVYAVRVKERDRLLAELGEDGINCAIHYPVPLHLQEAYRHLGYARGCFPIAEQCADQFLSLPMYPELTGDQIQTVVSGLKSRLNGAAKANELEFRHCSHP